MHPVRNGVIAGVGVGDMVSCSLNFWIRVLSKLDLLVGFRLLLKIDSIRSGKKPMWQFHDRLKIVLWRYPGISNYSCVTTSGAIGAVYVHRCLEYTWKSRCSFAFSVYGSQSCIKIFLCLPAAHTFDTVAYYHSVPTSVRWLATQSQLKFLSKLF